MRGSDPTMSKLAQLAGVSNAILWRRFSSIDDVVRSLYERSIDRLQLVADDVFAQQSGWDADIERITHRAQQEGTLRADVDARDLTLAAFGIGYYVFLPPEARLRVIARQLAITLDGLRADGARNPLPGSGITSDEIQGYYRQRIL